MMIEPPIDKLIDSLEGKCTEVTENGVTQNVDGKYALVCLVSKRAKFLQEKKVDFLEENNLRAISVAAQEVYEGKVIPIIGE